MEPIQQLRNTALGKHFGFPECCIAEFAKNFCQTTKARYPRGPWVGSGFIPCARCAEVALDFAKFLVERIVPNRQCVLPFGTARPRYPGTCSCLTALHR